MTLSAAEITAWLGAFLWPFMRVGAMMFVAPIFGNTQIPMRIRLVMTIALTVAVMPAVGDVPAMDALSLEALIVALHQVVIGLAMGLLLAMAFQTVVIAGEAIALTMGLGFASMIDPQSGQSVPVVSQFLQVTITLMFLLLGGHLMLIELTANSFQPIPVGMEGLSRSAIAVLLAWATQMYAGAVLVALPAIIMLLMVNMALGVMTRAAPQMNIFSVGFPLTMLVGFILLMTLIIPSLPNRMSGIWSSAFNALGRMLGV